MQGFDFLLLVIYLLLFLYLDLNGVVVVYGLGLFLGVYEPNLTAVSSMLSSEWYLNAIQ